MDVNLYRYGILTLGWLLCLSLSLSPETWAQKCPRDKTRNCKVGAKRDRIGCCEAPRRLKSRRKTCLAGQVKQSDGQCCWSGQVWSNPESRCVGEAKCPSSSEDYRQSMYPFADSCVCLYGREVGELTQGRCCKPGQEWLPRHGCSGPIKSKQVQRDNTEKHAMIKRGLKSLKAQHKGPHPKWMNEEGDSCVEGDRIVKGLMFAISAYIEFKTQLNNNKDDWSVSLSYFVNQISLRKLQVMIRKTIRELTLDQRLNIYAAIEHLINAHASLEVEISKLEDGTLNEIDEATRAQWRLKYPWDGEFSIDLRHFSHLKGYNGDYLDPLRFTIDFWARRARGHMAKLTYTLLTYAQNYVLSKQERWEHLYVSEAICTKRRKAEVKRRLKIRTDFERSHPSLIKWVKIPSGSFNMGSNDGGSNEKPIHQVRMSAFELSESEVTVGQYRKCVEAGVCTSPMTGERCNWNTSGRQDHPINCVDWGQARTFARWTGGDLPTEAQWEYAARGGQNFKYSGSDDASAVGWHGEDYSLGSTHPVKGKKSNGYGLYDMSGNVSEWTLDEWHDSYSGAPDSGDQAWGGEPTCMSACYNGLLKRVIRGGSWYRYDCDLRIVSRSIYSADDYNFYLGFRVRRTIP